jgi:hypothetical protein
MDRRHLERWLTEEQAGHEDAADAAFVQLFSSMPRVEPGPAFVDAAVTAAWRWRARRRRLLVAGSAAALLLVAVAAAIALAGAPQIATGVVKGVALTGSRLLPWLVAYATVAMDSWWTLARVGGVIASALLTPTRAVAIVGFELVGLLAFYALQRVTGARRLGDAQL